MLVFNIRRSEHITDALVSLHWLRVAERIRFKVAVLAYQSINGLPPSYLHGFIRLSQAGRPGLRSASSDRVMVPITRSSIGNRAFPVSGAEVWNNLSSHVTCTPQPQHLPYAPQYIFVFSLLPRTCCIARRPAVHCILSSDYTTFHSFYFVICFFCSHRVFALA
jgi:hypothetical protein